MQPLEDKILNFEKENGLMNSVYKGVYWWQLVRYELSKGRGQRVIKSMHAEKKTNYKLSTRATRCIKFYKILSLTFSRKTPTILILRHARLKYEKGEWIDIYSEFISEEFSKTGVRLIFLDPTSNIKYESNISNNTIPLDIFTVFSKILQFFTPLIYGVPKDLQRVRKNLELKIERNDIEKFISKKIRAFVANQLMYRLLFLLIKPKLIISSERSGLEAILVAARKSKVPFVELQHGSPVEGKLNYDNQGFYNKNYTPDYFITYGGIYRDIVKKIKIAEYHMHLGNQYMTKISERINSLNIKKKKDTIVVISQPDIDQHIADWILDNRESLKRFKLIVCLHPQYDFVHNTPYDEISFLDVRKSRNIDIYKELKKSEFVIGVYSTTLYDATIFDCNILILKQYDNNKMRHFTSMGYGAYITKFPSEDQLDILIKKNKHYLPAFDSYIKGSFYNEVYLHAIKQR